MMLDDGKGTMENATRPGVPAPQTDDRREPGPAVPERPRGKGRALDRLRHALKRNRRFILFWLVLFLLVIFGYRLGLDRHVLAALAIAWGLATQIFVAAFAMMIGWLATMPFLGPVLVKVITLPIVLLLNGLAFLASMVGIKFGHKKRVFEARVAATLLMVGILIGYVLGKLF